jgi:hypothetical protein
MLKHGVGAFEDFCEWHDNEATRHRENRVRRILTRVERAELRCLETIERMHRHRSKSRASGGWPPVLFEVH